MISAEQFTLVVAVVNTIFGLRNCSIGHHRITVGVEIDTGDALKLESVIICRKKIEQFI